MHVRRLALLALLAQLLIGFGSAPASNAATAHTNAIEQAGTIFSDDFEAGLGSNWTTPPPTDNGFFELNATYAHSGTHSVFLGQNAAGNATSSLVLAIDLTGKTDVFLDFWARATGDDAYRSVSISGNGGASWVDLPDLNTASQHFSHQLFDIYSIAHANGLPLNNQFRIRFSYRNSRCCSDTQVNDGLVIDDVRLAERAQAIANFPFGPETFESGNVAQGLYPQSTEAGVAEINATYANSGTHSVFLGQSTAGNATASLILAFDLTGKTDVFLDFWARATGDDAYRSVSISSDGGASWVDLPDLNTASQHFSHQLFDIYNIAHANGLPLNNQFRIRFSYRNSRCCSDTQASDGFVIDDLRLTERAQVIASFPFGPETFESGDVAQGLYPQSTGGGVAEIGINYPHGGAKSMVLGQSVAGNASASLVLALDLTDQKDVLLDFWARATGNDAYRSVSISDNGGANWTQILDLSDVSPSFTHQSLNIASVAADKGLALNNQFRIRFYYGNSRCCGTEQANDGLILDDIKLVRTNLSGKVYNEAVTAGNEVDGAYVEICSASNICLTVKSNSDGSYGFGDLASGTYTLRALPPAGNNHLIGTLGVTLAGNTPLTNQDILLPKATGLPAGAVVTPLIGLVDGVPSVFWQTSVQISQKGCANGTASYQVIANGAIVRNGSLAETPVGTYSTQLAPFFPIHGNAQVSVSIQCPSALIQVFILPFWIDPSGLVVNTQGQPIVDATVTLYQADAVDGPFASVASGSGVMSPANRVNPMKTGSNGAFGWDVIAGFYRVRAAKAGCTAPGTTQAFNESAVLTIPPPVTDLRIVLFCGEKALTFLPVVRR